jgi:hypothetical protein
VDPEPGLIGPGLGWATHVQVYSMAIKEAVTTTIIEGSLMLDK